MTEPSGKQIPRFDLQSRANISISTEHAHIHRGKAYSISEQDSLSGGATLDYLITVPSSNDDTPHLRIMNVDTTGAPCRVILYESPFTIEASGTQILPKNHNRTSTNVSCIWVSVASVTLNNSLSAQLEKRIINGAKQSGGSTEKAEVEWDLALGKSYILRTINDSGGAISAGTFLFWYE